ncbi:uncharacterized protein LOC128549894 [Mercenaria mercenaria]|uniref:uncharacterized protein LOC128549894 n=1 Tax=Mercenaria mercenaria TaxID=6596 RepID=UPI00234F68FB|nr:uncharacterized protein LOC128549894 [Mercenaria mercenaria]
MAAKGIGTNASDELFDFICSPCNKKDRNSEAAKYCVDCQEYLCGACVVHHSSFAVLAGHTLVGRSKFGNTSGADIKHLPSVPTERCTIHKTKLMDMYCADHDSIGCHVCFTINHRPCQNIHYIPEFVQSVRQDENVKRITEEIKTVMSAAEYFMKQNRKAKTKNNKSKKVCLKEIKSFRADINEVTDQLEKASVAEIEENHNELDKMFQLILDNIHDALDKLTKYEAEMRSSQNNPSQLFVATKLCKEIILDTEKYMKVEDQRTCLAFTRNQNILKVLQNCDSLGEQNCTSQEDLYEILSHKNYNVKLEEDICSCCIISSCMLDSGDILLADNSNRNIKRVECKTFSVQDSLKLPHYPLSVCKVSKWKIAVTLSNNIVQIVDTTESLLPSSSFKTDHRCIGIAVVNGQLMVCENGKKAHIYTMNGKRLKAIDKISDANFISEIPMCDGKMLQHVADRQNGDILWVYSGQELDNSCGVCSDGYGNVFVCCEESNCVVQAGLDGKHVGDVMPMSLGIKNPQAVCFDKQNSKLIVAAQNRIHIFLISRHVVYYKN